MDVFIKPNFTWSTKWHSRNEIFQLIVDNESEILHMETFVLSQKGSYQ